MSTNPHKGHRERVKQKFLKNGTDVMEKHEILELMLFYSIPQRDTNPIAHELLERFGSISSLIDAPIDILRQAKLSESTIVYLKMIPELCRLYIQEREERRLEDFDIEVIADIMGAKFIGRTEEAVGLMLFDSAKRKLFYDIVNHGAIGSCDMYSRKMMELAVSNKASYAIIAHNHPSTSLLPSKTDLTATKMLIKSFAMVGVKLEDHLIFSDKEYLSLRTSGFFNF